MLYFRYTLCAMFIAGLTSGNVFAVEVKKSIAKCAQIAGDLERLGCFDSIARANGIDKPKDITPTISGKGKWNVGIESNPVDDSKTVTLTLKAESGRSRLGSPVVMVVRCQSDETNLYISWSDYLGSEAEVLARIGKQDAVTSQWSVSTDSKATFYPYEPTQYIRAMMTADSFVAQVTPYNESPVTAVFDTRGLERALKPLSETCHWK